MSDLPYTKKSLGQHWLSDTATLEDICDMAVISHHDTVLEVGPGVGTLTKHLAERAGKVIAVEFDQRLAENLTQKYAGTNVSIVPEDILKFDVNQMPAGYKVVANIPYYLTSNLLRVLLSSSNPPSMLVLLMQKEVAERINAKPGQMSMLSIGVQLYCDVELGQIVPPEMFTPPPKVNSQVIKLTYRPEPLFTDLDTHIFFQLPRAGFSEKRKKLKTALSSSGELGLDKQAAGELLEKAGLNPDARAQELSLQDWYQLHNLYRAQIPH